MSCKEVCGSSEDRVWRERWSGGDSGAPAGNLVRLGDDDVLGGDRECSGRGRQHSRDRQMMP
jgi:hypothetical protein